VADRPYDPYNQGTFWAKLRARFPSFEGFPLRVFTGQTDADLASYRVEHFMIQTATVDDQGMDITAKDALGFADAKKAQAPLVSNGRLLADLTAVATAATLTPSGIGNDEYPASGTLVLGGDELVTFTRSGDNLTLARGQFGTTASAHDEDTVCQLALRYSSQRVSAIIYDLLVNYTPGIDPDWCDLDAWTQEDDTYIGRLYSGIVASPTAVNTVLNELIEQAGVSLWFDTSLNRMQFQTLRPVSTTATLYDDNRVVSNTLKSQEQPGLRASEVWTYYGVKDPTNKSDKEANYACAIATIDADSSSDYKVPAIRKILSRWISADNRSAAQRLNDMTLARFKDAPRDLAFALFASEESVPQMGQGIKVEAAIFQDDQGAREVLPAYVTSVEFTETGTMIRAQELLLNETTLPPTDRTVFLDVDHFNVNLRDVYDSVYSTLPTDAEIVFTVSPGAYIGGAVVGGRSLDVGTWPADTILTLRIASATDTDSKILGRGGEGGGSDNPVRSAPFNAGEAGGVALYTRKAITLENYGTIAGGGGGGEPRVVNTRHPTTRVVIPGGGGAGYNARTPEGVRRGGLPGQATFTDYGADPDAGDRQVPHAGTTTEGGRGAKHESGRGGAGGDLAEAGFSKSGASGYSAAGVAIDGASYITFAVPGTILGAQIN
jgi:hypothetical protein